MKTADAQAKKRASQERYITITVMVVIGKLIQKKYFVIQINCMTSICSLAIFILAWTPYALISLTSAFIDPNVSEGLNGTIPAILAKSSMVWTPVFYIFLNKTIRAAIFGSAFGTTTEVSTSRGITFESTNLKVYLYYLMFF